MSLKNLRSVVQKIRRKISLHHRLMKTATILFFLFLLLFALVSFLSPVLKIANEIVFGPVNVLSVVVPQKQTLKNTDGRTNILLLGAGGGLHEGADLTDTIMVASFKSNLDDLEKASQSAVFLISLPRDLYLDSLKGKINTAYEIGLTQGTDSGLAMAKGVVTEVTGLPIHYALKVDFSAFTKIVDLLNGIEVNVEKSFEDQQYPITGKENDTCGGNDPDFKCRFETLKFNAGPQLMNGDTALKFVRSRHATNEEGTDFARAKRQQLVLSALKGKLMSSETLLNPSRIESIYNLVKKNLTSDVTPNQIPDFLKVFLKQKDKIQMQSIVVDMELLSNPPIDERGWILLPKTGNFDEIHQMIKEKMN